MSERLRRSQRVLAVQAQLDRLAKWNLIDLQSQAAALKFQQHNLLRFLSGESEIAGIFASTMMRRLQFIAGALAAIETELAGQSLRHQEERRRLRHAERIVAAVEQELRYKNARQQLDEIFAAILQRGS